MTVQADACKSMVEFTHDVGIPENLITDGTGQFTRKDAKFVKGSETNANEDSTTEQSRKELESCSCVRCWIPHYVLEVKMTKKKALKCIRDFRLIYEVKLLSHVACGDDRSYWSDYRHQRMTLEFSMTT